MKCNFFERAFPVLMVVFAILAIGSAGLTLWLAYRVVMWLTATPA